MIFIIIKWFFFLALAYAILSFLLTILWFITCVIMEKGWEDAPEDDFL